MKTLPLNKIIACVAVLVSIIALSFSINEGKKNREHQKLSVQPHLEVRFHFLENISGYELINNGLGPAKITSFRVFIDNIEYYHWERIRSEFNLKDSMHWSWPTENSYIMPSEEFTLFAFQRKSDSAIKLENDLRKKINIKLCYCSLYNDCWSYLLKFDSDVEKAVKTCE